jgi:SAM-dependent methyltransferase
MDALVTLDLLTKSGELFANSPDAREVLVPGKPGYAGGALGHTINLWETWSTLTDAVRAGTAVFERRSEDRPEQARSFMASMHLFASENAPLVLAEIDITNVKRVLDVGGGSGAYSIAFCRAKPDLEAVIFDLPDIVPLTREYAAAAGLSERISTVTGDFNAEGLPTGFDLVYMSQILHSNSREQNAELIKNAYRSLNPGGQIVVQEFVVDEGRVSPPGPVLFALNMLVGTKAGDTFTEREIKTWLSGAGLTDIRRADPPTGTTLLIGKKG